MSQDRQEWFIKQQEKVFNENKPSEDTQSSNDFDLDAEEIASWNKSEESTFPQDPANPIVQVDISFSDAGASKVSSPMPSPTSSSGDFLGFVKRVISRTASGTSPANALGDAGKTQVFVLEESTISQLGRYLNRLKALLWEKEKRVLELNKRMKRTKSKSQQDIDKYTRWALDSLGNVARSYYENRLLWLNTQIEIEVYYLRSWTKISELIEILLRTKSVSVYQQLLEMGVFAEKRLGGNEESKQNGKKVYILVDVKEIDLPEKYRLLKNSLSQMNLILDELQTKFKEVQKDAGKSLKPSERYLKLRVLLKKAALDSLQDSFEGFYYHRIDKSSQHEFARLIADERHATGIALVKWKELLVPNINEIGPQMVVKGVFHFMKKVMIEHNLIPDADALLLSTDDDQAGDVKSESKSELLSKEPIPVLNVLKLYIDRLIYPRFSSMFTTFIQPGDQENDTIFMKKCAWLSKLSQDDFKIHKQLQCKDFDSNILQKFGNVLDAPIFPYSTAIKHLSRLESECDNVPSNIVGHFVLFGKLIEEQAKLEYIQDKKFVYSADDLVPVIEWCLVHARVSKMHEIISYCHRFLGHESSTGLGGYYLSSIEVATSALMNRQAADYGFDDDAKPLKQ